MIDKAFVDSFVRKILVKNIYTFNPPSLYSCLLYAIKCSMSFVGNFVVVNSFDLSKALFIVVFVFLLKLF